MDIVTYAMAKKYTDNAISSAGAPWIELTGTLPAGQTLLTLSDSSITTDSVIDYYTDIFGVEPTNIVVTTGSITLTFEAQESVLGVKVRVS